MLETSNRLAEEWQRLSSETRAREERMRGLIDAGCRLLTESFEIVFCVRNLAVVQLGTIETGSSLRPH